MKLNNVIYDTPQQPYNDQAFEQLFKAHFKALHAYANVMLKDEDDAEEIVQNMFLKFWEKRDLLNIQSSIKAYLYKCVYHDSLNFLKHQQIKTKYQNFAAYSMNAEHPSASSKIEMTELESRIGIALSELPEQCRTIFQMSRFEELKYREIADRLGLSIKTIENQMGKALRILRLELADFLSLLLLGLMYYNDYFK